MTPHTSPHRRGWSRHIAAAALLALSLSTFPQITHSAIRAGQRIPSIPTVKDLSGSAFNSADLKHGNTLLVFFSVYNPDTDALFSIINKTLAKQSAPPKVVGINVDPILKEVSDFVKRTQTRYRIVPDLELTLTDKFRVSDTPTIFLIDHSGVVRFAKSDINVKTPAALERDLRNAIGKTPASKTLRNTDKQPETSTPETPRKPQDFSQKKLVGTVTRQTIPSPAGRPSLLYITEDSVLWKYDVSTGARDEVAADVESACWSPDGKAIAFATLENSGVWTIVLGSRPENISSTGRTPSWSPKGDLIAYIAGRDEIWIHRKTTGKKWRLPVRGTSANWTSDGSLLIVSDNEHRDWLISPYAKESIINKLVK